MEWNLDDSRPIWPQIKDYLMRCIVAGKYPMGEPFPTVRELAEDAKVNRNTMQRALSELENEGLVITNRTSGRVVTTDNELVVSIRKNIAKNNIDHFLQEMKVLGFTADEASRMVLEAVSDHGSGSGHEADPDHRSGNNPEADSDHVSGNNPESDSDHVSGNNPEADSDRESGSGHDFTYRHIEKKGGN